MSLSIFDTGKTPHYMRMMIFVDGTNFLARMKEELNLSFDTHKPPIEVLTLANRLTEPFFRAIGIVKIRRYWFSSYPNSVNPHDLAKSLRQQNFEAKLFKKKNGKEKGVDIALAKEMLVNAFNQNFNIGLLIAGDEDYLELVAEVKRYGSLVWGAFFKSGMSGELEIAFDEFHYILEYGNNPIYLESEEYRRLVGNLD